MVFVIAVSLHLYSHPMKSNFVTSIQQFFRNLVLNATGTERTIYEFLEDGDISRALNMLTSNEADVDNALREYYPQKHDIMNRRNRYPRGKEPYITCKLPRCRQRYINEIELFFLLGAPVVWRKDDGDDEAYKLFTDFLAANRFDSAMRKVKRIAGSETECAKLYRLYRDEANNPQCDVVIVARSLGYELRTLKDQYGKLVVAAYGYKLRDSRGRPEQHWDFLTADATYMAAKSAVGWQVERYPNPTGKINLIYYQQPKAWDGVEPRLAREEEIDSKIGDTNNYFADPIAIATADVVQSMVDPHTPAKLLQITGPNGRFEYVNPPQASELRRSEKENLEQSILFDTFTPDFSFDKLRGLGSISGVAIRNAMALGYIKRANRMEIYGELIDREKSVILAVLAFLHPDMAAKLAELKVSFEFGEPFGDDEQAAWQALSQLYGAGLVSLEEAVSRLSLTDKPEEEIDRIRLGRMEQTGVAEQAEPQQEPATAEEEEPQSEEQEEQA